MENSQQKRNWINLRDAIVLGMFSVLSFLIETTLGLILYAFASIPLAGGIVSGLFDAILIFLAAYLVPRRGAALLFAVLLLSMSTVTPSFGPPGVYKIVIGIALGAAVEAILLVLGRSVWVYIFATGVAFALSIPVTYLAWCHYGIPGADKLKPLLLTLICVYFFIGVCGGSVGAWIYHARLQKHSAIVRLRLGKDSRHGTSG